MKVGDPILSILAFHLVAQDLFRLRAERLAAFGRVCKPHAVLLALLVIQQDGDRVGIGNADDLAGEWLRWVYLAWCCAAATANRPSLSTTSACEDEKGRFGFCDRIAEWGAMVICTFALRQNRHRQWRFALLESSFFTPRFTPHFTPKYPRRNSLF